MAKSSGLGDNFWLSGNDLSGDTQSLNVSSPHPTIDVTPINSLGYQRLGGLRDGIMNWVSYFNPTGAHPVLSALPTTDVLTTYVPGLGSATQAIGNWAACQQSLQVNYDPTRAVGGALTIAVNAQADGFGQEWGQLLTPGIRTDTAATNGASLNNGAATNFGGQIYLHVFAPFTGTDVTVKVQDSADNATFADLVGATFTQTVSAPGYQRLALSNSATVRQYLRAVTITTGGFTAASFAVVFVRNPIAGQVF